VLAFTRLDERLKIVCHELLMGRNEFAAFFRYIDYATKTCDLVQLINEYYAGLICQRANLATLISTEPVAVAYALAVINVRDRFSVTPPWVLKQYPVVDYERPGRQPREKR